MSPVSRFLGSLFVTRSLAVLLACLTVSPVAMGQSILVATTDETGTPGGAHVANLIAEFSSGTTVIDSVELSNGAAPPAGFYDGYDLVVIGSVYTAIDAADFTAIQTAIQDETSTSFLLFNDSCSTCGSNAAEALSVVNVVTGEALSLGAAINANVSATPNAASPYAASFVGVLDPFEMGFLSAIDGAAANNSLYEEGANTVGVFYPTAESSGSCIFYINDMSGFVGTKYTANQSSINTAFLDAATNPMGSCARSATGNYVIAADDSPATHPSLTIEADSTDNILVVAENDVEALAEGLAINAANTDTMSAEGGTIAIVAGNLQYTPAAGFSGTDTFTYEICVPSGACDTARVTVDVRSPFPTDIPVMPAPLLLLLIGMLGVTGSVVQRRHRE